jgi:hypothetical protein
MPPIVSPVEALTTTIEAIIDAIPPAIQPVFDPVALPVKAQGTVLVTVGGRDGRTIVETLVDPFAFGIKPLVDAIPPAIEAFLNDIATIHRKNWGNIEQ